MDRRSGGTRGSEDEIDMTSFSDWFPQASTSYDHPFGIPTAIPTHIPSSTYTQFATTATHFGVDASSTTPALIMDPTGSATTNPDNTTPPPTAFLSGDNNNDNAWQRMGQGVKGGIIVAMIIGIVAIICVSIWYCCGGKNKWRRKHQASGHAGGVLPLHVRRNRSVRNGNGGQQEGQASPPTQLGGDAPPPRYEEVVPPQHHTLAGGMAHVRQEEEDGVVADGKMPLSEIPFEDVVLDHTTSESASSQSFASMHHNGMGDTRGHTNT